MDRKYTKEEIEFLRVNSNDNDSKTLTSLFNVRFCTDRSVKSITACMYRNGFKSSVITQYEKGVRRSPSTEFKKGMIPWNKGKKGLRFSPGSEFKKGHKPHNTQPIGAIKFTKDGYRMIKVAETKPSRYGWKLLQRQIYEETNGPIEESEKVIFLDGDKNNLDPTNLAVVSSSKLLILNKHKLIRNDCDLTKTGLIIADVIQTIQQKSKRN